MSELCQWYVHMESHGADVMFDVPILNTQECVRVHVCRAHGEELQKIYGIWRGNFGEL